MKDEILKLRDEGKTYDEITKILGCSKSTISYHCNNSNRGTHNKIAEDIILGIREYYRTHTLIETSEYFNVSVATVQKYSEKKQIILTTNEKKKRRVESVIKRRKNIKLLAVEHKGGKCIKCGYNKCIGALEFHHLDPKEKDFHLSKGGVTRSWEIIKKELDKCILVCANCHREIHEEMKNTDM